MCDPVGERREIDELSSEAKILTLALAELKMSNKKLSEIIKATKNLENIIILTILKVY